MALVRNPVRQADHDYEYMVPEPDIPSLSGWKA